MIKIFISIALCAICAAGAFAAATGNAGKNIKWKLDKGTLTFTGIGPMKNFGKDRPWHTDLVEKIIVEEGVTSIGNNMARDCRKLITVDIPSSVCSIGDYAFSNCHALYEVRLPYGVETIGTRAFMDCRTFIEIEFPISLKSVGTEAFANCTNLTTARLNASLEILGDEAFKNDKQLTTLSDLPSFIDQKSFHLYGLNLTAVKNYWAKKDEIAQKFGNASGALHAKTDGAGNAVEPSDVDLEIPFTGVSNPNTFVVIIANENYGKLVNVPFARNDGETFRRYCMRTLGVPEKNILFFPDASYGAMREAMSDLRMINDAVGDEMKLIFYYAGHGAPDDSTLEPYIIPVDAARVSKDVCISLASLYKEVGDMKLKSATFFMDACFSGATRDGGMMASARGIAREPKKQGLTGNIAVISATSKDQTALPYNEKGHGMFTYYLLKHLQETKGQSTLAELHQYVKDNVSRNSTIVNRKEQTPTINLSTAASANIDSWRLND